MTTIIIKFYRTTYLQKVVSFIFILQVFAWHNLVLDNVSIDVGMLGAISSITRLKDGIPRR